MLKGLLCTALTGAIVIVGNAAPATAATTVSGTIENYAVDGTLTVGDSSVTATTVYSRSGGTRTAKATVYYWFGSTYYRTVETKTGTSSGGVAAKATKQLGGADVVGGKGYHKLEYGAYTWEGNTSKGTIPSSSTKL